jgi:hypothetical protein
LAAIACAIVPFLAGCGAAGTTSQVAQSTVQGRAMQLMLADVNQVRRFVYGSGSVKDAENAATDLMAWSGRMAELFPSEQASADYVDMSSERAREAPAAMARTAGLLLGAVQSGSRSATGDHLALVERDGCGFCHLSGSR